MTKQKYQCQGCGRIIVYDEDKFEDGTECKKCGEELVLEEDSEYEDDDESEDEEESSDDTYDAVIWCKNCGDNGTESIPSNKRSADYLKTHECSNCRFIGDEEVYRE